MDEKEDIIIGALTELMEQGITFEEIREVLDAEEQEWIFGGH